MEVLMRHVLGILVIVGLLTGVACAPAAAPTPTTAPAKPTATTAAATKPAEAATAAPKPAAETGTPKPAGAAAKPASADWKADWDKMLAAAKREGKVVIAGAPGELYRRAVLAFQSAYPDIQVEFIGMQPPEFPARVFTERQAGQYLWDVYMIGWKTPLDLKGRGIFDPLKPGVILPEVLDDSKWLAGFEDGWVDKERQFVFQFETRLTFMGYVNRDVVPESELSTVDQLLDPKWKGKISAQDPRQAGPMSVFMAYLLSVKGEDWVRKLLSHDLTIMRTGRDQIEALVRGSYPVGLSINSADVEQFRREGLTANVKPLAPESPAGRRLTSGFGNVTLINRAPHPSAAKVFINWLLTKEGQKAYVEATGNNSRRLDVEGKGEVAPDPKVKYEVNEREWSPLFMNMDPAVAIAKEIFK